jgi:uncharacterized protein (DUF983 family)
VTLRDPDVCKCGGPGRFVKRRRGKGFLSRRHECVRCGHRWTSYQSLINPKKLRAALLIVRVEFVIVGAHA